MVRIVLNSHTPESAEPYVTKGIAKAFAKSETLKTEIVESKPDRIIFKLQQAYTPKIIHYTKPVNSLVTLSLDDQGKVKYHKDMWNEKDYSHEGLGKIMKTLNGDYLTKVCGSYLLLSGQKLTMARSRSRQRICPEMPSNRTSWSRHSIFLGCGMNYNRKT